MVATRPDWCISRQRIWGVPIAVFLCRKCGEPLRDAAINKRHRRPLHARVRRRLVHPHRPKSCSPPAPPAPAATPTFRKEMDILDVWFESGSSSHAVLDFDPDTQQTPDDPIPAPTSTPRAATSIAAGSCPRCSAPSACTTARPSSPSPPIGWTLDEKGRALSKSLGNFIDPVAIMDQLGGDIVRLWVASRRLPRRRRRQPSPAPPPRRRNLPQAPQHLPLPPRRAQRDRPRHRPSPRLRPAPHGRGRRRRPL